MFRIIIQLYRNTSCLDYNAKCFKIMNKFEI